MAYDILWVDDQPQAVADLRDNAVDFLNEFGIVGNLTLVRAKQDDDIRESMKLDSQNRDLDMLAVVIVPSLESGRPPFARRP